MSKDDAIKLALGALVYFHLYAEGEKEEALAEEAITALREAQAEQPAQQEPVAWLVCSVNSDGSLSLEHASAWEEAAHEHINDAITEHSIENAATWVVRPAYTSPPAQRTWVGLTDDEIIDIRRKTTARQHGEWADTKAFARAFEAKLKEKNT